jgi:hypothetical protein
LLILILQGMPFHAMVVFTLGYDFLFKSTVGHCDDSNQSESNLFYYLSSRN